MWDPLCNLFSGTLLSEPCSLEITLNRELTSLTATSKHSKHSTRHLIKGPSRDKSRKTFSDLDDKVTIASHSFP